MLWKYLIAPIKFKDSNYYGLEEKNIATLITLHQATFFISIIFVNISNLVRRGSSFHLKIGPSYFSLKNR
jgi:hypothetical protein